MPRHPDYVPHGVIPAVLLPFDENLSIDEAAYRAHLRDVSRDDGLSLIAPLWNPVENGSVASRSPAKELQQSGKNPDGKISQGVLHND